MSYSLRYFHIDKLLDAVVFNDFDTVKRLIDNKILIFDSSQSIDGEIDAIHIALFNNNNEMLEHLINCQLNTSHGEEITDYYVKNVLHFHKIEGYLKHICYHDNVKGLEILLDKIAINETFKQYDINQLGSLIISNHSAKVLDYTYNGMLQSFFHSDTLYPDLHEVFRQDLTLEAMARGHQKEQTGEFLSNFKNNDPVLFQATLLMVIIDTYFKKEVYATKNLYALSILEQYFQEAIDIEALNYDSIYDRLNKLKPELLQKGYKNVLMYTNRTLQSLENQPQNFNISFDKLFLDNEVNVEVKAMMDKAYIQKEKNKLNHQLVNQSSSTRRLKV